MVITAVTTFTTTVRDRENVETGGGKWYSTSEQHSDRCTEKIIYYMNTILGIKCIIKVKK